MKFSPQLLPNNPAGITPDWEALLTQFLTTWPRLLIRLMNTCRMRISIRKLKTYSSEHIKAMTKDLSLLLQHEGYVEADCSPNMNFAEIMHFFRSEDVTSLKSRKNMRQNGKTVGGTISYTKKVGNVNVDQHWNIREEMSTGYVLATCLKLYVFDHMELTAAQEQRYESLQAIWDNRIIDDLNDIAVLVKQTQYTSIDIFQAYDQAIISGYEAL
jgi:hypothetical protein